MTQDARERSLLALASWDAPRVRALLTLARARRAAPERALEGRSVGLLFFEPSTRTRVSFEIACHRCGAVPVSLTGEGTSVVKGETLLDTAMVVESMGVDALVVRAKASGAPALIASRVACPVINAGDGTHAHPTQALADALALDDAWDLGGSFDFARRRVVIVGDVAHSRVARSNVACLTKLGAEVVCVGPPTMAPGSLAALGCRVSHDLDAEIEGADALMALRIQLERGAGAALASARDYRAAFGVTPERAARLPAHARVMHPGPMNRGVEIDSEVADGGRSSVLAQVAAGVAVRVAALETCVRPA